MNDNDRVSITWEPPATPIPAEDWHQQTSTDGGKTWNPPLPKLPPHVFEDLIADEDDLIGRVCDQINRANPDLPIEECQAIARDIIRLVREYS